MHGCVAGTVTVATLGSPNTTPCDLAATGTTNLTMKATSVFPTASGNNGTVTIAVVTLSGNKISLGVGSKNGSSVDNRIDYKLQIKSRCMIANYLTRILNLTTFTVTLASYIVGFVCAIAVCSYIHIVLNQLATEHFNKSSHININTS